MIKNKGQIVAEYSILIGIIVAALIVMNIYIKRGMQARLKDAVDVQTTGTIAGISVGDTGFNTSQYQYEPDYNFRTAQSTYNTDGSERMAPGGPSTSSRTTTGLTMVTEIINGTH